MSGDEKTALIAGSDSDFNDLLRWILERKGIKVRCVDGGKTAVSRCLAQPPDVVFLDTSLRGLGVEEVHDNLQAFEATRMIAVIVIATSPDDFAFLPTLRPELDRVIQKPFTREELDGALEAVLEARTRVTAGETIAQAGYHGPRERSR